MRIFRTIIYKNNNYILTINQSGAINSSLNPNIYVGSLEAAQTQGQSILLGNTLNGNNGISFTNNCTVTISFTPKSKYANKNGNFLVHYDNGIIQNLRFKISFSSEN